MYRQNSPGGKTKLPSITQDKDLALISYTTLPALKMTMQSSFRVPRSKSPATRLSGPARSRSQMRPIEIEDGEYIAPVKDVTDLLGKDELIDYQNQFVSFKGMTVEAAVRTSPVTTSLSFTTMMAQALMETIFTSTFP